MRDACYCDYGDPPQFLHTEERKARTGKKCTECGGQILPGEHYEHVRGKWDNSVDTYRTCARCLRLRQWVAAHVPCFCWYYTTVRENAQETIDEYKHECPGLWFGWGRLEVAIRKHRKATRLAA